MISGVIVTRWTNLYKIVGDNKYSFYEFRKFNPNVRIRWTANHIPYPRALITVIRTRHRKPELRNLMVLAGLFLISFLIVFFCGMGVFFSLRMVWT